MEQQQRLLVAFLLSILLWFAYNELVIKPYETPPPGAVQPGTEQPAPEGSAPNSTVPAVGPAAVINETAGLEAPAAGAPTVVVDTDLIRLTITTRGGRLLALELKHHRETVAPDSPPLNLVQPKDILPGTLRLTEGQSDAAVQYAADADALQLTGGEERALVLRGKLPDGRAIEKRFTFHGNLYEFEIAVALERQPQVGLVLTAIQIHDPASVGWESLIGLQGSKYTYHWMSSLKDEALVIENATWSGIASTYFLMAAVPLNGAANAHFQRVDDLPVAWQESADGTAAFAVYAGPKEEESLERAGHELSRARDFGYFWFVAIPLLGALRLLHALFGNYGVAIVLLTTAVKIVTIPLTQSTFRNMREMQRIQPQMIKLRERFKDDPAALQKEMMELYKRHRVNPFSGCLPMLLQLPIFVGLYNALSAAIELRHAPFTLWITDLSAPDRLMVPGLPFGIPVLTILMGASMLVQQWISPQQGDPTQQRIMMLMPVVFTFMFINLPSGLVLYWLVNNVLTIAHQHWMLRTSK